MFERDMMISGLQRQRQLLAGLIDQIENKSALELSDLNLCQEGTRAIARNLRKLRKIKSDYFTYGDTVVYS